MNLLGSALYDPAGAVSKSTASLIAMTAFDTTNLRVAVTVPSHGILRIRMCCAITGATTVPVILLGALNGATVVGRVAPAVFTGTSSALTADATAVADFCVTGLTPGAMNLDAAYGVEVVVASTNIKYGGPNNTTTNDAWGAFVFEVWDPKSEPTNFGLLSIDANGRIDVIKVAGTTQTARDLGASVLLSTGTGTGQLDFTSGVVKANATQWLGGTIPAVTVTGVPLVDLKYTLGTLSPAAAGTVRAESVTNDVGITQAGADKAWSTATRVLTAGTNIALAKGTGLTGLNDIAATSIVSSGAITTSGGKVSNVGTCDTLTTYTGNTVQTGDAYARLGSPAGASVSADVAAVKTDTAAVKTKTDSLTFTVASKVDSNITTVAGTTVNGAGTAGNPWGP